MKIGFLVNPVAGLGGAVGLKGSDGAAVQELARARGASPLSGLRARQALSFFAQACPRARVVTGAGDLGEAWISDLGLDLHVLATPHATRGSDRTTALARLMQTEVDLLLVAGGDGTMRDVVTAFGAQATQPAVIGIPCGVKMHSGVFARSPTAAGKALVNLEKSNGSLKMRAVEIVDIDEATLREGRLEPRLYGTLFAPQSPAYLQAPKARSPADSAAILASTAAAIVAEMEPDTLYILGPGSSAGAVATALGIAQPLLGVSAVIDRVCCACDTDAATLERLAEGRRVKIILGITGRQGFLLGRGNQQISAKLIAQAGREGLLVLASEQKLAGLESGNQLWVDTGDAALDARLSGYLRVRSHPARFSMFRVSGC